jgi:hypothetical protein
MGDKPKCPVCAQMGWDESKVHPMKKPNAFQRLWRKIANSKAVEQVGEEIGKTMDQR